MKGKNKVFASSRFGSFRLLRWLLPLSFFGVFFFYPLANILAYSFDLSALSSENLHIVRDALSFTFYQALLSTLLTLLLGLPAAWLFARYSFPGKSLLRALTAVPFMLPTVVVAAGFNALLGPRGWLHTLFPFFSFQFTGTLFAILLAHVFYNTTIVIRIVGNAFSNFDPRLEQAARVLGADTFRVWRDVRLPLLRPSLLAAGLLVFIFDFTSFGVILLLGDAAMSTLEVEIYVQALKMLNLPLAALLSVIQLLCTLVFAMLYTRTSARLTTQISPRAARNNLRPPRRPLEKVFLAGMILILLAVYILPMAALPLRSVSRLEAARGERGEVQYGLTLDYYAELFVNRRGSLFYVPPARAAFNSLLYAALTIFLSLVMGFPAASALAKPGRLEKWLDPILILPLGASAVTLGLGFVISFNRPPLRLLASPLLIPFAHTLVALPFVIRTLQPALASIPERLRQAAASLGASPLRVWQTVDWPIIWRAVLAASTFAFTVSLGEFGATLLLSRPEYPTIPVAIYRFLSQPGGLNYGQAMAMATILMMLTTIGILVIERVRVEGAGEF
ncbi:MAG: iron ABC transporter permease [Anaerolineales bacterium]